MPKGLGTIDGEVSRLSSGWIAAGVLAVAWAGFLINEHIQAGRVRSVMARIVHVDHLNSFTTYELYDGHRIRRTGAWGQVGEKVPVKIYVRSREPAE